MPPQPPNQTMAIVALVLGIVGCCIFQLLSIGAIIVGAIALKKINENPQEYGGRGMAMTGLILGIVGVIVGIIGLIVLFSFYLPLLEFCDENPEDERCEGVASSQAGATDVPARGPAASSPLGWAMPWLPGGPWPHAT